MGGSENTDMGLQSGNEGLLSYASSGRNMNTLPKVSGAAANTYFASGWDPVASFSRSDNFGVSSVVSHGDFSNSLYHSDMENQGMSSNCLVPAALSYPELVSKVHCYGSGSYSEMVGSLELGEHGKIANTGYSRTTNDSNSQNVLSTPLGRTEASPDGKKRKRAPDSDSPQKSNKNAEEGPQKNLSQETSEISKQDASKPKTEQNNEKNMHTKQMGKQAAESSHSGEASKENYIHVRARRGQATNSHSLAERLRREKISERMRLLQELVPGCNKITGKAVMLDEIINYVQSLQQQVEFLSMKLATVNPELHFDMERVLSKDFSQGVSSAAHGFGPGMSSSHPYQLGNLQGSFPAIPHMIPQFNHLAQPVLDNDFQTLLQMGYNSGSGTDNLGPNGRLRPDL